MSTDESVPREERERTKHAEVLALIDEAMDEAIAQEEASP